MQHSPYTRHKKPLNSQMNVVPYIDVMLVLLIIFMVSAPMLTTGVEINLPKEKTQTISHDKKLPVIVSIKQNGELFLSYDNRIDEPISKEALFQKISDLGQQNTDDEGKSNLQVMVNADSSNEYSAIMGVMAGLQRSGISKIGLLADPQTRQTINTNNK